MATAREIKEEREIVSGVGNFTTTLQQIAAGRMVRLRKIVLASKRFADESVVILRELQLEHAKNIERELRQNARQLSVDGKKNIPVIKKKTSIIVVSSDQGLCGSYNTEIFRKAEEVVAKHKDADYFVIGSKGQKYFEKIAKKYTLKYYPYNIPEEVGIEDLRPLISMFYHYDQIYLIFNRYINTTTRKPTFIELAIPNIQIDEIEKERAEGSYIFEPNLDDLIDSVSAKLRYALFRQQILDSKLALYTAQMIAMQTASENAKDLLKDLNLQYNKARRKLVDKKIQEVQAGRSLWDQD